MRRYRAELDHVYRDSHPTMKALLAMIDLVTPRLGEFATAIRSGIGARDRVTLLGDAAHPTLQSLAQGACMAIEDGVCLAETDRHSQWRLRGAFRRYENARYLRTARVQFESRYHWDNFYHVGGIEREVDCADAGRAQRGRDVPVPRLALRRLHAARTRRAA